MREFLPLKLAFGKTIHTFQGASVGPVAPGQPPNAIEAVICNPGTRKFEGICPGLFYTLLSRLTTLGTEDEKTSSAMYFIGEDMNKNRIRNTTSKDNGEKYKNVQKRQKWVDFLKSNVRKSTMKAEELDDLFHWANKTKFDQADLESIITTHIKQK